VAERLGDARLEVGDLLLDRPLLVLLALLELGVDPLRLGGDDLAESGSRLLADLVAGRDDDLAGRGEDDRVRRGRRLVLGELCLDRLGGRDDLFCPGGPLGLQVGLRPGQLGVQLVLRAIDACPELVLELGQPDA
jgi:hypothetical protein